MKNFLCLFSLLAGLTVFDSIYALNNTQCSAKDAKAIQAAVKLFLDSDPAAIRYKDIVVIKKLCLGNYAKTTIHPKKPVTDDATIYAKQTNGVWQIIGYGTDFPPEFMDEIPSELK